MNEFHPTDLCDRGCDPFSVMLRIARADHGLALV